MSQRPNCLRSMKVEQDRAAVAQERAAILALKPHYEALRAKRAIREERDFLAARNREVWQ